MPVPAPTQIQREIIGQFSPMTAKMKSKPHRANSRSDWNKVRTRVMRWCLQVKLAQHYDTFSAILLQTGDKPIVEYSNKDDFWGAKPSADELVGKNILGRLLMEMRENIKKPDYIGDLVAPLEIPNFRLLDKPIEAIHCDQSFQDERQRILL